MPGQRSRRYSSHIATICGEGTAFLRAASDSLECPRDPCPTHPEHIQVTAYRCSRPTFDPAHALHTHYASGHTRADHPTTLHVHRGHRHTMSHPPSFDPAHDNTREPTPDAPREFTDAELDGLIASLLSDHGESDSPEELIAPLGQREALDAALAAAAQSAADETAAETDEPATSRTATPEQSSSPAADAESGQVLSLPPARPSRRPLWLLAAAAVAVPVVWLSVAGMLPQRTDTPDLGTELQWASISEAMASSDFTLATSPQWDRCAAQAAASASVSSVGDVVGFGPVTYHGDEATLLITLTGQAGVFDVYIVEAECGTAESTEPRAYSRLGEL